MASSIYLYSYDGTNPLQLSKWKIRVGHQLYYNSPILSYKQDETSRPDIKEPVLKYKSNVGGTVTELLVSEGDIVKCGAPLLKVKPCTHPVIMKDLCAECGTDLRSLDRDNFENVTAAATFSMVHVVPELKVSYEQAEKLSQDDEDRLLKNEKLVLLVDLDQTLIHTTNDDVPENMKDVAHFKLYGKHSPWYHTKLRPGTKDFLEKISRFYELHICTFGARVYAHKIAEILDPDGKYFSHRILSRDESFDPTTKTANLKALFPKGDHLVCIIDDREDVWNFAPNVVRVKPYTFFRNTGDINAPPVSSSVAEDPSKKLENTVAAKDLKPSQINEVSTTTSVPTSEEANAAGEIQNTEMKSTELNEANAIAEIKQSQLNSTNATAKDTNLKHVEKKPVTQCYVQFTNESSAFVKKVIMPQAPQITKTNSTDVRKENKPSIKENELSIKENEPSIKENEPSIKENEPSIKENEPSIKENEPSIKENEPMEFVPITENNTVEPNSPSNCDVDSDKKTDGDEDQAESSVLDIVETDDYLLYLEEILISIHKTFYSLHKKSKEAGKKAIPDLKKVVPDVRKKVLKNVNIVFSGIVPTNCDPQRDQFWLIAESLGATVHKDLVLDSSKQRTTHLIAYKANTTKVNSAKQHKNIWIVTLDWLLCCEDRWERADERLFSLPDDTSSESENCSHFLKKLNRLKRPHTPAKKEDESEEDKFSARVFAEAGLALSQDEIEDMDKEIEQACSEESSDSEDSKKSSQSSSSSAESLSSGDYPKGWKRRRKNDAIEEEMLLKALEGDSSDADTIGSVDEEMAEAVKREFENV